MAILNKRGLRKRELRKCKLSALLLLATFKFRF